MNGDCIERLPQASQCQDAGKDGILESASNFAYRVLKEIEALAGTTSCKSVQLLKLKKWAQEQGCWFTDRSQFGDFFERIKAHNKYFDACPYRMIGFAENCDGKVCGVLVQPFVQNARLATKQEIHDEFLRLGFHPEDDGDYYSNGQHDVFDAVDGNVLVDEDNNFYFIDTIIYPSDMDGYAIYRSLSPHYSKPIHVE